MTGPLLLLGLIVGVAADFGGNEASAVTLLDAAQSVAQTIPAPSFVPVGFKRPGFHRGHGGVHKSFSGFPKSFKGPQFTAGRRLGVDGGTFGKRLVGPKFSAGKRSRAAMFANRGLVGPEFFAGKRFRAGSRLQANKGVRPGIGAISKGFSGPRLFLGGSFGDVRVAIRSGLTGAPRFLGNRFGHGVVIVRSGSVGVQRFFGPQFGDGGVVVRNGSGGTRRFSGQRFGDSGVAIRSGFGADSSSSTTGCASAESWSAIGLSVHSGGQESFPPPSSPSGGHLREPRPRSPPSGRRAASALAVGAALA